MAGLEDLVLLKKSAELADSNWNLVREWDDFARDTVGRQLVKAVDSVGANVAEAFGRFHYGEKINFLYYARGSVFESKYWINRAEKRNLIPGEIHQAFAAQLKDIAIRINNFARALKSQRSSRSKISDLREPGPEYTTEETLIFSNDDLSWLSKSPQNLN